MPWFQKKPIRIQAVQFREVNLPWPDGVYYIMPTDIRGPEPGYYLDTLEGRMKVKDGDYIVTGVEGEKYCCDQRIFEKTYDAV